jgi:O-antigen/teichoic acid export membrane protein
MALISAVVVSVVVARAMGPERLGYFAYMTWLTNMSNTVGCLGIPMSARKYMAEYLGRGDGGTARAIFFATFRLQALIAAAVTGAGLILVYTVSDPAYHMVSALLVLPLFGRMTLSIPSQANMAAENMRANVPASVLNNVITVALVLLSIARGWGLVGVAAGMCIAHYVEFVVRTIPVLGWVRRLPHASLPRELRSRMISFSGYGMVLLVLNAVVWDRSDVVFLKALSPDIRQISFFSVVFNLSEKILLIPQTFGHAIGVSLMAQYGRNEKKLFPMVSAAGRYMFLCAVPLLTGAAVLSGPIIRIIYGHEYQPAIPIMTVVCLLAIPKSMLLPAQHLLQTTEKQKFLVGWGILCAIVNCGLDLLLIPAHQAMGAAYANGITQLVAMLGIWGFAVRVFPLSLHWGDLAKIVVSGAVMAGAVLLAIRQLHGPVALACGTVAGAAVFLGMLRLTRVLGATDRERMEPLSHHLPRPASRVFDGLMRFIAPGAIAEGAEI